MSRASRLAEADKQIVKPVPDTELALNSAGVPGGISATPLDRPLYVCGIGYALAVELGSQPVSLVKVSA